MNYLKILGFQLQLELDCNSKDEYLIPTERYKQELEAMKDIITKKDSNVIILPEMSYQEELFNYWKELSKNKLIVAGSVYNEGVNQTAVFHEEKSYFIPKCNASGAEPMVRTIKKCSPTDFQQNHLEDHTFFLDRKKIVVLNCMEYYQNAYYIARNNPDIFAIICTCSNNNTQVFKEETKALHNHCENIYTFMINCISNYMGKSYAQGESYIYGPIQRHEQEWLKRDGYNLDNHCSSILNLSNEPEYIYGEFKNNFSRFGRSDEYENNPRNIEIGKIKVKERRNLNG